VVDGALAGSLLDAVVRSLFEVSWGKARGFIATGKVKVDGVTVTEPTRRVGKGAAISLEMTAPRRPREHELAREQVVFVDAHVIVVRKPPGVSTVAFGDEEGVPLDERVKGFLARREKDKTSKKRVVSAGVGVVHRLDKETSGLIVFTRTWTAKKSLGLQFRQHTVHRRYFAIAHGEVRSQTFRSHLVEDRGDGRRGSIEARGGRGRVGTHGEPQLAITHVEAIEKLEGATLIACRLETGRTHQIRIHLSEAGHPIVGERVYTRRYTNAGGILLPAPRLMLHAAELGFKHPVHSGPGGPSANGEDEVEGEGREMRWEEPLPEDMRETLLRLGGHYDGGVAGGAPVTAGPARSRPRSRA
jgi:23S rRNA pseudouridine1911/1915/1917 synthase